MSKLSKALINLRTQTTFDDIDNYIHESSGRINKRLWIASPFISSERLFYYIFQISKIRKHNPSFRLLTDIKHISVNNYKILKFFIDNGELKTLKHLHSKIYIMDNYPVITSANLTPSGFYGNYESAIAGDNADIDRYEQMYDELWELGESVDIDALNIAMENSTFEDNDGFTKDFEPLKKLPKELTEKCSYEQFLKEFKKLENKYMEYGRIWETTPLKFEIDSFLNYLFHHSEEHSSKDYYYTNEVNPSANDTLIFQCIKEFQEWIQLDTSWDNESIRENYKNNALAIFSKENINNVKLKDISDFLSSNINTYLTNSVRFNWAKKFVQKNNIKDVIDYIIRLEKGSTLEIDKLVKNSPIAYMGESTLQELLGLIREDLPIRNENTNAGLRFLGYNV